jgi:prepilin-type N-terminal cleavage/methylation domain-containing protein
MRFANLRRTGRAPSMFASLHRARSGAAGFTMVELLVVIVIISVLMALILPAINSVRTAAIEAKVASELKQFDTAINNFKAKFGIEPPSRITLYTTPGGWISDPESKAIIKRMWPQFDFSMPAGSFPDWWKNPDYPMNAGECLLFFLGGVSKDAPTPISANGYVPIGFSTNPAQPFSLKGTRIPPFIEFDPGRIKDSDISALPPYDIRIPEYFDSIPGQTKPILYFSSYEGSGYRVIELPVGSTIQDVYRTSKSAVVPGVASQSFTAHKPQTFQIISPGYDGEYGAGGVFNPDLPNSGLTDVSNMPDRAAFDNITNFHTGRLNP